MLNKKYTIGGVIILVIIAGVVFFSRNNSSTPDASVLEKGIKNLTRESAAKMIETGLQVNQLKTQYFSYNQQLGHYSVGGYSADDIKQTKALAEAGYVTIVEKKPSQWMSDYITYDFTDKAKPFFAKREQVSSDDKNVLILLAEVEKVEVTGLTEQVVEGGMNTRTADFTATYKATPIGAIIDEKKAIEPFKWKAKFVLYDDGWRIAQ